MAATALAQYGKEIIGVAAGARAAYDLFKDVKQALSGTAVNSTGSGRNVLADKELEYWKENTNVETILGIDIDTLDDFIYGLEKQFNLSEADLREFRKLKSRGAHGKLIQTINYASDFAMKYGYIVMKRNEGEFDCAIVLYTINFKLKPLKGWFPWSSETPVSLTPAELDAIKSNYLPTKALEGFKNEGLVQSITYEGN